MRRTFHAFTVLITFLSLHLKAEQAVSADQFVDSAGINTHLSWGPLYQDNFPLVLQRLQELGVRHLRNGLVDIKQPTYYDHLTKLGEAGIKILLITSPEQTPNLITSYPDRAPGSIEAFEAPNEYDNRKGPNWVATLQSFMPVLYRAVKGNHATATMPVVGPSLTQRPSYPALGDQSSYIDIGNMHNYPGGRNPGTPGWGGPDAAGNRYGSIPWNLYLGVNSWGGKPVWTTEYGYDNNPTGSHTVPESVSAIYLPRVLLEQYLNKVQRTYLFELLSKNDLNDGGFAILHIDGTPKPAFHAVRNLLQLLTDKGGSFKPSNLEFSLTGNTASVHHLLLQKQDSSFYLALWVEKPCFDVDKKQPIEVPSQNISVGFKTKPSKIKIYRLDEAGNMTSSPLASTDQTVNLSVSDKVLIVNVSFVKT